MTKFTVKALLSTFALGIFGMVAADNAPQLSFSHEHGFYYTGFELTLTAGTPGCTIRYTLDGSDPRTSAGSVITGSPATLTVSPYIHPGRGITPGVVIRACAIGNNDTGRVETNTYIFPAEVKYQPDISEELMPYWPDETWEDCSYPPNLLGWMQYDRQLIDLEIDPEVVSKDEYFAAFESTLADIPTFSLVTDPASLFDPDTGIYINSVWSGREWERSGSLELLPSTEDGFQVNTGIRIRGGFSAAGLFAKHAFRLFFRTEYGDPKLEYPLFNDYGTDEFDKIDLRCDQNNSWHIGNNYADFVHDPVARDMQGDMHQPYTRTRFYHLFVNGMYWGLYETQERSEASYAESYFGGDKEDYDVIKSSGPSYDYEPYTLEATNGDLNAAKALWDLAKAGFTAENYNKAMGLNPDGSRNPDYPILLDADNLIDYMIIIYFIANRDGPGELKGGIRINNFFGIYNRKNPDGFKFFVHDAETSFISLNDNITHSPTIAGETFDRFNPAWLQQQLMVNPEYRQRFADRAYKHLYNQGALTAANNIERFKARADQINQAIVDESARWGDVGGDYAKPFTKLETWQPVITSFLTNYLPQRTNVVINQFMNMGWLNGIMPPEFDTNDFVADDDGFRMTKGNAFDLKNPNQSGDIYYTLDNTDPRVSGGNINSSAMVYQYEITVRSTVFLKARIKVGDEWSPLAERVICTSDGKNLKLTEINYKPADQINGEDTINGQQLEFLELKNFGTDTLDISGYTFTKGIQFNFPLNSIMPPGSFRVIAADSAAFESIYGFKPFGQFGGNLNNNGEEVCLETPSGKRLIHLTYNLDKVWYDAADGGGFTLVPVNNNSNLAYQAKEDWRISAYRLGSPGKDDPGPVYDSVIITEVMAHSNPPLVDAIELYNPSLNDISIGEWCLSDDQNRPDKWHIPDGTMIPSKGYQVFYEGHYDGETLSYNTGEFGAAFSVSSAGETLYLFSTDSDGVVNRFVCKYEVGATENNVSFGDYKNTLGDTKKVMLDTLYLGSANAGFRKSPLVFKTIMYHPWGDNPEYILIKNRTDSLVKLYDEKEPAVTWKIDGIDFRFPSGAGIAPGDSMFLVEKKFAAGTFRNIRHVDAGTGVYNFDGQLKNGGEKISICKPLIAGNDTSYTVAYIDLESVEYDDRSPWSRDADGNKYALRRKDDNAFADDATNWTRIYSTIPVAGAGDNKRVRINTLTSLDASGSYDPEGKVLSYSWKLLSKPASSNVTLESTLKSPKITPDKAGMYTISLVVSNSDISSAPSLVNVYAFENRPPVALFNKGSYRTPVNIQVDMDANRSYDPDYEELFYDWEITSRPAGSTAQLEKSDAVIASFTPDVVGTYNISLTIDDGEASTSKSIALYATAASEINDNTSGSGMMIYPNPVHDDAMIEFCLDRDEDVTVSLSDINGHILLIQRIVSAQAGMNRYIINFDDLHAKEGVYFVRLQSDEFVINEKIIFIP
jgi:hypothetical protein